MTIHACSRRDVLLNQLYEACDGESLNRLTLIESPNVVFSERVQYRFPRSGRRRIRAKWTRRPMNWRTIRRGGVVRLGNMLVVHPSVAAELRRAVIENIEKEFFGEALLPGFVGHAVSR